MLATSQNYFYLLGAPTAWVCKDQLRWQCEDGKGDTGFVFHGPDAKLLTARDSHMFKSSILEVELRIAWTTIIYVWQDLRARGLCLKVTLPL